jgi:hypothetical protein
MLAAARRAHAARGERGGELLESGGAGTTSRIKAL